MRLLPSELDARLQSGVTNLCTIWRITRRDGEVYGFTDHDRALSIAGVAYEPNAGFSAGAIEKSASLAIDSASAAGALSSDAISAEGLANGLWDGARVDVWRVDWSDPALRVHIFTGRIGEARRGANAFEAELRGLQASLNVPVGRVFSRFCDADVGDGRCGVNLSASAFRGLGEITEIISASAFVASGLGAFETGWFTDGRIAWDLGGASEIGVHRFSEAGGVFELLEPAPQIELGATFIVTAGCDKRFATCQAKFANQVNFRGHPHMPGNDAIQSGPAQSGNDGSSRWTG
ncbi:MAG: DUF2163 domain-containing protein [Hyphomonadaceae bacterium]